MCFNKPKLITQELLFNKNDIHYIANALEMSIEKFVELCKKDPNIWLRTTTSFYEAQKDIKNMVLPVSESHEFYKEKCGEDYKLTYSIKEFETLEDEQLQIFTEMLETDFSYIKLPSRVDLLSVEITAKGEKGEYKSVYNDFWCMKIKGKWYKVDKTVYTDYEKIKTTD